MRDDTLAELQVMKPEEIKIVKALTRKVADILAKEFSKRNLHLLDGKIEVGKRKSDGKIIVIDEISTSVFRACKNFVYDDNKNCLKYKECIETTYRNGKRTIKAKNLLNPDQIADVFGFTND